MRDRVVSKDLFMLIYFPDRCKTQEMCDEAVDNCLAALKFTPDWLVMMMMFYQRRNNYNPKQTINR